MVGCRQDEWALAQGSANTGSPSLPAPFFSRRPAKLEDPHSQPFSAPTPAPLVPGTLAPGCQAEGLEVGAMLSLVSGTKE